MIGQNIALSKRPVALHDVPDQTDIHLPDHLCPDRCSAGQRPEQSSPTSVEALRIARAVRVESPPKLDGTLNDPIWQQAAPIADF